MNHVLAQINIASMKASLDNPIMREFVENTDRINALAERSPGFLWRYKEDEAAKSDLPLTVFKDNSILVNMSVWNSMEDLFKFTYQSDHKEIFKKRKQWFQLLEDSHMACWYIADGQWPLLSEGKKRLEYMDAFGNSPYAFTFKNLYTYQEFTEYSPKPIAP